MPEIEKVREMLFLAGEDGDVILLDQNRINSLLAAILFLTALMAKSNPELARTLGLKRKFFGGWKT